jgi:hypothetical protein
MYITVEDYVLPSDPKIFLTLWQRHYRSCGGVGSGDISLGLTSKEMFTPTSVRVGGGQFWPAIPSQMQYCV